MEYVCDSLKELDTGLNIYKAGKAFKALEMIHESQIDLVLLDVELPDMNGFSLANRIRNMRSKVRCCRSYSLQGPTPTR